MIQQTSRSPYITDSRVQTFYFLRRMGESGEIFSLEDLSNIPHGYQISSLRRNLAEWKRLMLTPYTPANGLKFYDDKRPDRQFYTCRPLSLWDDWMPFMRSCIWDRRPIPPPPPTSSLPTITLFLEQEEYLPLVSLLSCAFLLDLCIFLIKDIRRRWTSPIWSRLLL